MKSTLCGYGISGHEQFGGDLFAHGTRQKECAAAIGDKADAHERFAEDASSAASTMSHARAKFTPAPHIRR